MIRYNHRMIRFIALIAFVAGLAPGSPMDTPAANGMPNIVIIFTDDQGYGDVGIYGAQGWTTPNIDRLAAEGMRFTDFYVAQPVCSASRAALLTGCYPNRIGITGALGPGAKHGINANELTLAELCKQRGYATAIFGKWHLGHREPFLPLQHGFDAYLGIPYSNDMWPLHPSVAHLPDAAQRRKQGYPNLPLIENNAIVDDEIVPDEQKEFTREFTLRAVDFIKRSVEKERPFFVYVPHPMPHVPLFTSDAFAGTSEQGAYGDVMQEIDWSVGEIMNALERAGIADNTLFIFTTDNGPWLNYGNHAGTTGPLREGKGTTFEGGVRVPCIMRWPGQIPAGSVCNEPAMTIDILPTIAAIINGQLPEHTIDGKSILPLLEGEDGATSPHEALFFYYHANDLEAMRMGRWKLHFPHVYRSMVGRTPGMDGSPGNYDYSVKTGLELYDLHNDIGETTNVADEYPDVVERMQELAERMRAELGDNLTKREPSAKREPGRVME